MSKNEKRYLIKAPTVTKEGVIAVGLHGNWHPAIIYYKDLVEQAKKGEHYENVRLEYLGAGEVDFKDKLVIGDASLGKVWLDTKPYSKDKFKGDLYVVLSEIRYTPESESSKGELVGYRLGSPKGKLLTYTKDKVLLQCAKLHAEGKTLLQNMVYVGEGEGYLKNYEGKTLDVEYIAKSKKTEPKKPVASDVSSGASIAEDQYTAEQREWLDKGKESGVNYSLYESPEYTAEHMGCIYEVLKAGLEDKVDYLLDSKMDIKIVRLYKVDIIMGKDIKPYYNRELNVEQVNALRLGAAKGIDVEHLNNAQIEARFMRDAINRCISGLWDAGDTIDPRVLTK